MGLYKDLKVGEISSLIFGVVFIPVVSLFSTINFWFWACIVSIWTLACLKIFDEWEGRRFRVMYEILTQQCNVHEYLNQLFVLSCRVKGGKAKLIMAICFADGYLNLGDADTALLHLHNVVVDENKIYPAIRGVVINYYDRCAWAYIMKQNEKAAEEMLAKMKRQTNFLRHGSKARNICEDILMSRQMDLNMFRGNYDGVEEFWTVRFPDSPLVVQVRLKDILRDVYVYEGRIEEAEKCRRFILQNGGDTYYATKLQG